MEKKYAKTHKKSKICKNTFVNNDGNNVNGPPYLHQFVIKMDG